MRQGNADVLERAIVRADLTAARLRGTLHILGLLRRDQQNARRALYDAERQAESLYRLRDLLLVSGARRRRVS
jgi:hypothetical protein